MENPDQEKKEIRRPMNAFLIFCKRHRTMVREKNPNMDNRSVTRILGDLWANLQEDDKSQYIDLAKQYKEAFMKANPDYRWHNPDRLLNIPALKSPSHLGSLKPMPPLFNMTSDGEGQMLSTKLADPSEMGGLSMLMEPSHHVGTTSKQSTTEGLKTEQSATVVSHGLSPHERVNSPSSSSSQSLFHLAQMCTAEIGEGHYEGYSQNQHASEDHTDKVEHNSGALDLSTKQNLIQVEKTHKSSAGQNFGSSNKDSYPDNKLMGQIRSRSEITEDQVMSRSHNTEKITTTKVVNNYTSLLNTSNLQTRGGNNVDMKDNSKKKEDKPIVSYGKGIMDHIIEKLYSTDNAGTASVNVKQSLNKNKDKLVTSKVKVESKPISDKETINKPDSNFLQPFHKPSTLDKIREEFLRGEKFRSRKRCYSEPCSDVLYTTPIHGSAKLQKLSVVSHDSHDETDGGDSRADPDSHVRKSKRRNRGQRYQELINEGIIQPSKERIASQKHEPDGCHGNNSEEGDDENTQQDSDLTYDVLSVYPRQIRKRTYSESEKGRSLMDEAKRYKTGDFDLEAHIATLPPCSLDKIGRPLKRQNSRTRTASESSVKSLTEVEIQVVEEKPKEIVLTSLPHFKPRDEDQSKNTGPVVGSRKRKARKHSITHLQKVVEPKDQQKPNVTHLVADTTHEKKPITPPKIEQINQTLENSNLEQLSSTLQAASNDSKNSKAIDKMEFQNENSEKPNTVTSENTEKLNDRGEFIDKVKEVKTEILEAEKIDKEVKTRVPHEANEAGVHIASSEQGHVLKSAREILSTCVKTDPMTSFDTSDKVINVLKQRYLSGTGEISSDTIKENIESCETDVESKLVEEKLYVDESVKDKNLSMCEDEHHTAIPSNKNIDSCAITGHKITDPVTGTTQNCIRDQFDGQCNQMLSTEVEATTLFDLPLNNNRRQSDAKSEQNQIDSSFVNSDVTCSDSSSNLINTELEKSTKPLHTKVDISTKPLDIEVDKSTKPLDTKVDKSTKPLDNEVDKSTNPFNNEVDNSINVLNIAVDQSNDSCKDKGNMKELDKLKESGTPLSTDTCKDGATVALNMPITAVLS